MNVEKVYETLAKQYGVSVAEVKRDMQAAIDEAYKQPTAAALAVPRKGEVPTVEELIGHSVEIIQKNETS